MTQEEFFKRYTFSISRDRIGGGGFGTVYKAYDNVLHREVAIKVSMVKTTTDGKKTFSLKDEFEALNHVPKHPNIANYEEFYSYEMPNGIFDYAVMQYYPDGNLSDAIRQGLTPEQKDDIALQLLEGVDFLHKHQVVHRDLKPGNILIVKHGGRIIPLITDFGLSKSANAGADSYFSNSFGGGTQRYSSPEQLQGKPLRFNTDLWSYGAIVYELFTGLPLFEAGSGAANTAQADLEIYNKIVNGDVKSLRGMPDRWRRVVERCVVVDPDRRVRSSGELLQTLRGDDDETGPAAPSPKPPQQTAPQRDKTHNDKSGNGPAAPDSSPDNTKKRGLIWVALGVAVLAALLVLLLRPKAVDADTQAYQSCQSVEDYRAYMRDYGRNAKHYAEAQRVVDKHVVDSAARAQQALAAAEAQQKAAAEQKAKEEADKKEESAYKKCTTVSGCDSYLKAYPKGRYVEEVRTKKSQLEEQARIDAEAKAQKEAEAKARAEAKAKAEAESKGGNGSAGGHEYVDLGLPSGTLWATCNVGAAKPEGYGNYYAWGETKPQAGNAYSWNSYKYANGGGLTKYCNYSEFGNKGFTDNLTTLQSGDDPAAANWGSGWRTPSKSQWDELIANTTNQWTTRNGVSGRLFTSKKNGQTLFLPAAVGRWRGELDGTGSYGYYWSRSRGTDDPDSAWYLGFNSDGCYVSRTYRCKGFSVRPVREK